MKENCQPVISASMLKVWYIKKHKTLFSSIYEREHNPWSNQFRWKTNNQFKYHNEEYNYEGFTARVISLSHIIMHKCSIFQWLYCFWILCLTLWKYCSENIFSVNFHTIHWKLQMCPNIDWKITNADNYFFKQCSVKITVTFQTHFRLCMRSIVEDKKHALVSVFISYNKINKLNCVSSILLAVYTITSCDCNANVHACDLIWEKSIAK